MGEAVSIRMAGGAVSSCLNSSIKTEVRSLEGSLSGLPQCLTKHLFGARSLRCRNYFHVFLDGLIESSALFQAAPGPDARELAAGNEVRPYPNISSPGVVAVDVLLGHPTAPSLKRASR